jgi:hypothetical protein
MIFGASAKMGWIYQIAVDPAAHSALRVAVVMSECYLPSRRPTAWMAIGTIAKKTGIACSATIWMRTARQSG